MRRKYLRRLFRHLPHQGGDIFPDVLVRVSEGGKGRGEDLCLDHRLRQVHRVFADLAEG